jgi:hypothetical protein
MPKQRKASKPAPAASIGTDKNATRTATDTVHVNLYLDEVFPPYYLSKQPKPQSCPTCKVLCGECGSWVPWEQWNRNGYARAMRRLGEERPSWWRRALAWLREWWLVLYLAMIALWFLALTVNKLFVE